MNVNLDHVPRLRGEWPEYIGHFRWLAMSRSLRRVIRIFNEFLVPLSYLAKERGLWPGLKCISPFFPKMQKYIFI
jgi:hypothetical protein